MLPLNFDLVSAPICSTTGVAKSIPTSSVSSAEKIAGCVRSILPFPTFLPSIYRVPKPPFPIPSQTYAKTNITVCLPGVSFELQLW
jgi:hypothetical protein